MNVFFRWLLFVLLLSACRQSPVPSTIDLSENRQLLFLDSTAAAAAIIQDSMDGYFEKVTVTDMLLQMKLPADDTLSRVLLLKKYQAFLQTEVEGFTHQERAFCTAIFQNIQTNTQTLTADIIPTELRLIKIKGNHYGDGAFYTRENIILIPENEIKKQYESAFYETMLHELFHIYSRYHPTAQKALYELIGFKSIGGTDDLQFPDILKKRILLNPDGVDYGYAIELEKADSSFFAIPIIYSPVNGYVPERQDFFDYIQFDLFPIKPPYARMIQVRTNADGSSPIALDEVTGFYEQIQDNTNYIIHPDEVLADNFVFLVKGIQHPETLKRFSEGGQRLIGAMGEILER